MARQLWLLRHADAEPHGTREDSERRLTERGERQARLAGEAIARMGVEFDALLSSPKERALRTATVAAQAWSERTGRGRGGPRAACGGLRRAAGAGARWPAASEREAARLLVVGHEPDLSTWWRELTGARIDLKKGGLAVVRLDGASGELVADAAPQRAGADRGGWIGSGPHAAWTLGIHHRDHRPGRLLPRGAAAGEGV